jgi:hypothetical protein
MRPDALHRARIAVAVPLLLTFAACGGSSGNPNPKDTSRASSSTAHVIADGGIAIRVPRGWDGRVIFAGRRASGQPSATVLVLASFRLPADAGECERVLPVSGGQIVLRIYDYGSLAHVRWAEVSRISVSSRFLSPSLPGPPYAERRLDFFGRALRVGASFGGKADERNFRTVNRILASALPSAGIEVE